MAKCSNAECSADLARGTRRCATCGTLQEKAIAIRSEQTIDRRCNYTHNGQQCPAPQNGDGRCIWHVNRSSPGNPSALDYLLQHGVPHLPDWRDCFIAWTYNRDRIETCRTRMQMLEIIFHHLPQLGMDDRRIFDDEMEKIKAIEKRMQRAPTKPRQHSARDEISRLANLLNTTT